jgi:endonuclease G
MMMPSKEEQVASYLERVKAKPGVSRLIEVTLSGAGLEAAESPDVAAKRSAAREGMKKIDKGRPPNPEQAAGLEAIILPKIRPVLDVVDGRFSTDHPLWQELNDDGHAYRRGLLQAIPGVGRIELPGHPDYPYGGTGFVVGPGLIMTNRHVAAILTSGIGTRRLNFRPDVRAGIDFLRELDRPTGPTLRVKCVKMVHPYWDMALLEVPDLPPSVQPLVLSQRAVSGDESITVAAIGYPAFDTRNDARVQNDLFRRTFGVKRLQPGTLGRLARTESFGKMVDAVRHNCSTLGGNSGSALIDLDSGRVVALHFGGRYRVTNYGVPAIELASDGRVVDAGIRFEGPPPEASPPWSEWWDRADEAPPWSDEDDDAAGRPARDKLPKPPGRIAGRPVADGGVRFMVPLYVTLRLGDDGPGVCLDVEAQGEPEDETERLAIPWHDEDYGLRKGYDPEFLGKDLGLIPMPSAADPSVVAPTKDGGKVLHYQNFSIVTHARRRMALFCASNVTADPRLKKPEPHRAYTRKGLTGLGERDQERWYPDPRMSEEYQLPDVFYTRDDGAFDKGHIVRRDDVAWGKTYEDVRRANGDTYHVTNCSPQVAGFNRSNVGEDNWGQLENHVLTSAASERYCLFAGPVLDDKDDVFLGRAGGRARVRVKIPARYWKVIVVRTEDRVASYGFVLEQDLSDVTFEEFIVPEKFARFMEPLKEIQKKAGIEFPDVVLDADQHGTDEGLELAFRAEVRRRAGDREIVEESVMR